MLGLQSQWRLFLEPWKAFIFLGVWWPGGLGWASGHSVQEGVDKRMLMRSWSCRSLSTCPRVLSQMGLHILMLEDSDRLSCSLRAGWFYLIAYFRFGFFFKSDIMNGLFGKKSISLCIFLHLIQGWKTFQNRPWSFILCSHTFNIFHTISSTKFSSFSENPQVKGSFPWQIGKIEMCGGWIFVYMVRKPWTGSWGILWTWAITYSYRLIAQCAL